MKKVFLTTVLVASTMFATANNNPNPTIVNPTNNTTVENVLKSELNPFCKAIILGKTDMVKQMIQLGENVNEKCLGKTPAMYAARYNKAEILEILIKNNANLKETSDEEKYTALKFAELSNATEAIEVLNNN